jgi:hypothetical protein
MPYVRLATWISLLVLHIGFALNKATVYVLNGMVTIMKFSTSVFADLTMAAGKRPHTVSPIEYSGLFLRVTAHEAKSDHSYAGQNTIFYKTVTSMLQCKYGLKSTVKWLLRY